MRLWTCGLVVEVGQVEQLAPFRRVIRAAAAQCAEPCGPESGQAEGRGECCGVDPGALVEHARGAQGGQSPDPSRAAGGDRRGTHGGVTGGAAGAVRARSAPEGAGTLERVAQYAFGSVVEGRIDVSYAYPRFGSGAGALNELLERGASERLGMWLADGRDMVDGGEGPGWAWTHSESVDLMGAAGPYRSLLSNFYYYTGGAHPNGHGESMLLEVGEGTVRLLELAELFGPEAEWRAHLSGTVLASLAEQEAAAVLSGEITQLNEQDLATFTLGPAGLTFHFAPYAVGPYVQGSFRVTLAYEELMPLAAPGGALEAFAAKFGAD